MDRKEEMRSILNLKGPVRRGKTQNVEIQSSQRRPLVVKQTDNIRDIVDYMSKTRYSVYPVDTRIDSVHEDQLRARLKELTDSKFAYIAQSLHVSANVGDPNSFLGEIAFDVFLTELNAPAVVFSVLNQEVISDAARYYISGLVKEIVAMVRKFTNERFSAAFGLLCPSELESNESFRQGLSRITRETAKLCIPASLTMRTCKHAKIVRAFISGLAVTNSVLSYSFREMPPLWFLNMEQFQILMENIDKPEVTVTTQSRSGGKTLTLDVVKRLEKSGPTLLISDDEEFLYRTSGQIRSVVSIHELPERQKRLGPFTNIVAYYDPYEVQDNILKQPGIRHLWMFKVMLIVGNIFEKPPDVPRSVRVFKVLKQYQMDRQDARPVSTSESESTNPDQSVGNILDKDEDLEGALELHYKQDAIETQRQD